MAAWKDMGTGARAATVMFAVGGGAVVAYGISQSNVRPATPAPVAALEAPAAAPVPAAAVPIADPAPAPQPVAEAAPSVPVPAAPSFDNWRVDADGSALVAGRAEPGSGVSVLVDGVAVADAPTNPRGEFVALFTLMPNANPSLMTLVATLADGTVLASVQSVALAAIVGPAPAVVADAAPQTDTTLPDALAADASAPEAVLITEDGARVLQGAAAPGTEIAVTIDTIAYSALGDVVLSGRGQAGAFIRLYLDTVPVATGPVDPLGQWSVTLTDTLPGIYTLRADQVDASGKVTARYETPFKREAREALAAMVAAEADTDKIAAAPQPTEVAVTEAVAEEVAAPAPETAPETTLEPAAQAAPEPAPAQPADVAQVPAEPTAEPTAVPDANAPQPAASTPPEAAPAAPQEPEPEGAPPPALPAVTITVQPGFTLWGIARQQLGDGILYVQVFEANKDKIRNADLIYPGQVFILPTR